MASFAIPKLVAGQARRPELLACDRVLVAGERGRADLHSGGKVLVVPRHHRGKVHAVVEAIEDASARCMRWRYASVATSSISEAYTIRSVKNGHIYGILQCYARLFMAQPCYPPTRPQAMASPNTSHMHLYLIYSIYTCMVQARPSISPRSVLRLHTPRADHRAAQTHNLCSLRRLGSRRPSAW